VTTESFKILLKNLFIFLYISSNVSNDFLLKKAFSLENNFIKNTNQIQEEKPNNSDFSRDYILGPGDLIFLNFVGAPFLSSTFTINQEGEINIPELNLLYVSGFTLKELEELLKKKYSDYLYQPEVKISILKYRALQIYIAGEVKRPGVYDFDASFINNNFPGDYKDIPKTRVGNIYDAALPFPNHRLDDVFRRAKGITNYADLSKIVVIRENSISRGGGKIKTEINYLELIKNGDLSKNIRILDGDTIFVSKTNKKIKDQILSFNKSNLNADTIEVFVVGNIDTPSKGAIKLAQGSSLNQAIAASGGKQPLSGKVELIRFEEKGSRIRRVIDYDPNAPIESKSNPLLFEGDIINVQRNLIGRTTRVLGEITSPLTSGFFIYNIFAK
tara:strand:- start:92 stop:1252 length:1161 start_codon:yes stop_codon:yes gene_type:complete